MSHTHSRVAAIVAAGVLLAGVVVPLEAQSAQALPPECTTEVTWHNGTSYVKDDGTIVETGIHSTSRLVCGPTTDWTPGGDPSTGGEDPPSTPPAPPAPPGPELPKPPDSVPPSVAPPCVSGANNDPTPGQTTGEPTGNGATLLQNLAAMGADGMLKIESTGSSRVVTVDIPLGDPLGREGANPFAGMSPEEAARAMYWEGAVDPTYTEVVGTAKGVMNLIKLALNGLKSPAVRAEFRWAFRALDRASQSQVITELGRAAGAIEAEWKGNVPPEIRSVLDDIYHLMEQLIDMASTESPPANAAALYADAAGAQKAGGRDTGNTGVCGQIQQATATGISAPAGLSTTGDWARITFQGTAHGTLIEKIKSLAAAPVTCPPVEVDVTAGRPDVVNVFAGCAGTIVGGRVLTRQETRDLPLTDQAILMAGSETDPFVAGALDFSAWASAWAQGWQKPESQSLFANGRIAMFGDSKDGNLQYQAPLVAGGLRDVVVVAAMDEWGVEHPFLVKVAVKSQANCSTSDKVVGPGDDKFRAVVKDGALQLVRNLPFTLNLNLFCVADIRDSYRVTMDSSIPGTTPTVNADGSVTFTWTGSDVAGDGGVLTVTPWDETTGVPGESLDIPVVVRDVPPSCKDVEIVYDESELMGAPLQIPIECGMEGGLKVLSPPFLSFNVPGPDLMVQEVAGGKITSDGKTLTFTPAGKHVALSTAQVVPWSTNPLAYTPYPVKGKTFEITVRMTD